jgi:hypothetical protein
VFNPPLGHGLSVKLFGPGEPKKVFEFDVPDGWLCFPFPFKTRTLNRGEFLVSRFRRSFLFDIRR